MRGGWRLAALAWGVAACGCASRPGVLFEAADESLRWPSPPDRARIAYVGQLVTNEDLKPSRSFFDQIGETIFGREPAVGMVSPMAVCTDGGQRVFIADPGEEVVHVFDLETREYARWAPPEEEAAIRFSRPVGLAFDPRGRLLVCDSVEGAVLVFDPEGRYLGTFGDNLLQRPVGVAVDRTEERIFIADTGAHQIVVLAPDGEEIARIGERGTDPGQFNYPTYLAVGPEGRLYVSDSLNFRIQVFDRDLSPLRTIGRKGDLPGYFAQPKGLAIDPEGHVYAVDAHFEAVQVFDAEGRLLMTFGREGNAPGEFWLPAGIFIDAKGWIWVADSYNRRVQVFEYLRSESAS